MKKQIKEIKRHEVKVNHEKCVGCGLCQKDCVSGIITIQNGKAVFGTNSCIACGHCEAICPQNAVKLTGFTDEPIEIETQTRLDPEELMMAIKSRRSIRSFKNDDIPKEIVKQIIEAGRYAPTGGNAQNTGYIILGTRQKHAEALAVGMFRKLIKVVGNIVPQLKSFTIDKNFFFKGAPLVIVITGSSVNASLAAENMAFMAEAHGLGVLYSGFFTMCVNHNGKIRKLLKVARKEKAVTTLVIGYPNVRYRRTARREKAKVRMF